MITNLFLSLGGLNGAPLSEDGPNAVWCAFLLPTPELLQSPNLALRCLPKSHWLVIGGRKWHSGH